MIKNIIFDWKRTLYNPDEMTLISGAKEFLDLVKEKNIPMILIGKGGENMESELERLEMKTYFSEVFFQEGDKDIELFKKYVDVNNPKSTIIIGDRVRSELQIGNILGATTIWVRQGKFADEEPENESQTPDFVVGGLGEVKEVLEKL